MTRIVLSLVSHTNVGKTTLARTLLGRDIGEVRDAPHVTEFAEGHTLIEHDGDTLALWDTPGFGDSVRLAKRMRQSGQPLGWLLSQVWDRWRDRPFWASQQALRHVRDEADVLLYLVNAAERPEGAGYVAPEMEILGWVGKPVLVLLNQLGAPRPAEEEAADVDRWRAHLSTLAAAPLIHAVLPLDAFARCWVQEGALLDAIAAALTGEAQAAMRRLADRWSHQRRALFETSADAIAASLARIAATRVPLDAPPPIRERWRRLLAQVLPGRGAAESSADQDPALQALAERLDAEVRASTAELIALHGLEGRAEGEILARIAGQIERRAPISEGRAAALGGAIAGALAGLKADIATGGLTMGGGLLAGGLLGAIGAAGVARGVNRIRGNDRTWVAWSDAALAPFVEAALLRYLAVAHFGRGRGQWVASEAPPHWTAVVHDALVPYAEALDAAWSQRRAAGDADAIAQALKPVVRQALADVLATLYPAAAAHPDNPSP